MTNITQPHIQPLPNELIRLILSHVDEADRQQTLYACSLTNKMFHDVANPLLWNSPTTPKLSDQEKLLTYLIGKTPSSSRPPPPPHAQHIQRLSLFGETFTDHHFLRVLHHVPQLTHLRLHNFTQVSDNTIQQLAYFSPHLKSLTLEAIQLTPFTLTTIAHHCHQLSKLHLGYCIIIEPHILQPVIENRSLNELGLVSCHLHDTTAIEDITNCHTLTSLELGFCKLESLNTFLVKAATNNNNNNSDASAISYPLAGLKKVFFWDCMYLDNTIWLEFIKTHSQIVNVGTCDCRMTDDIMIPMSTYLPDLSRIRLLSQSYITSQGVRDLIYHAGPSLVHIECLFSSHIWASDFPEVSQLVDYEARGNLDDSFELDSTAIIEIRTSRNNNKDEQ